MTRDENLYEISLGVVLILLGGLIGVCGCAWLQSHPAVINNGEQFVGCVATDAVLGKPVAVIESDCGGDLASVVAALLGSTDPQVVGSPAHKEAVAHAHELLAKEAAR